MNVVTVGYPMAGDRKRFVDLFSHLTLGKIYPIRLPVDAIQFNVNYIETVGKLCG
jgi:hypothetical protein